MLVLVSSCQLDTKLRAWATEPFEAHDIMVKAQASDISHNTVGVWFVLICYCVLVLPF